MVDACAGTILREHFLDGLDGANTGTRTRVVLTNIAGYFFARER